MSIDNLNLGNQLPVSVGDFLSMPINERARFLAGVSELALISLEKGTSSTIVPEDTRSGGIPATAKFLLDGHFNGSPTIGAVSHATDCDRSSLRQFEEDVRFVEGMLFWYSDMRTKFESERTINNSRYTILPGMGIVFRDRDLAEIKRGGMESMLAKRTVAVYNPKILQVLGGLSVNPLRRRSGAHGAMIPDSMGNTLTDDPIKNISAITADFIAAQAIEHRRDSGYKTFAGELRRVIADQFGMDRHAEPLRYFDAFEHSFNPDKFRWAFDKAMVDAPRSNDPKERKINWLHVVSSQLYLKDVS